MTKILIIGSGTAGTMAANHLRKELPSGTTITIVDRDNQHHYQPGYLFVPFWMAPERIVKDRRDFLPDGVDYVESAVTKVDAENRTVALADGRSLEIPSVPEFLDIWKRPARTCTRAGSAST